jgi:hypothetical protein
MSFFIAYVLRHQVGQNLVRLDLLRQLSDLFLRSGMLL